MKKLKPLFLCLLLFLLNVGFIGTDMVFVEGGTFQMGSLEGADDEKPVHTVTVSSFYIMKFEVTQKEYEEVMGDSKAQFFFIGDNLPAQMYITDAYEFCNRLSKKDGFTPCYSGSVKNIQCNFSANGYRLPTEAEWEFAARGGNKSKGYMYAGSNNLSEVAWYWDNSEDTTHAVGKKVPNELGLYDMSGNVWEWCWDFHGKYPNSSVIDPRSRDSDDLGGHIVRGGSLYSDAVDCRVSDRGPGGGAGHALGLRLVRRK